MQQSKSSLLAQMAEGDNLRLAWQEIERKDGAGGVDRQQVGDFARRAEEELVQLQTELLTHEYVPEPYLELSIPKDDGERRVLGLPTVRDKVAQQALRQILEPQFERLFADVSYGYRPRKGPYKAARRVLHYLRHEDKRWLADCDIDAYFDTIPHDRLMARLETQVEDPAVRQLIRLWIGMGRVQRDGDWQSVEQGIPQGAVISPLLANFYLNGFDHYLLEQGYGLVRFADDFVILADSEAQAEQALLAAQHYLQAELGLVLNPGAAVSSIEAGFTFLGLRFTPAGTTLPDDKLAELEADLREDLQLEGKQLDPGNWPRLRGVQQYYGRLLPEPGQLALDGALLRACYHNLRAWRQAGRIPASALKPAWLEGLEFVSPTGQEQRLRWVRRLLRAVRREEPQLLDALTVVPQKLTRGATLRPLPLPEEEEEAAHREALRRIRKQQQTYRAKAALSSELLISRPGLTLGRSKGQVTVKEKGRIVARVPLAHLEHITIQHPRTTLTGQLLQACAEQEVGIYLLGQDGQPYAHVLGEAHPSAELGRAQLAAYDNGRGPALAQEIALGKVRNQRVLVKYLAKSGGRSRPELKTAARQALTVIEAELKRLKAEDLSPPLAELRPRLMAAEGRAATAYWRFLRHCLPPDSGFMGRSGRDARDPVNAALNYGYGMLYSRVQEALVSARLFLNLAYLHAPGEGDRPSLAFDLIEEFRVQAVDRAVAALWRRSAPLTMDGPYLDQESRRRLARQVLERLGRYEAFDGEERPLDQIIRLQARRLGAFLNGDRQRYKPYVGTW